MSTELNRHKAREEDKHTGMCTLTWSLALSTDMFKSITTFIHSLHYVNDRFCIFSYTYSHTVYDANCINYKQNDSLCSNTDYYINHLVSLSLHLYKYTMGQNVPVLKFITCLHKHLLIVLLRNVQNMFLRNFSARMVVVWL